VLLIDSGEKTHLDTLNSNFDEKHLKAKKLMHLSPTTANLKTAN